jgi:hypothetical protein
MTRVLFIDRAWPVVRQSVERFAELVQGTGVQVVFLSDKEPSRVAGNIETINVFDVPQRRSLEQLQADYPFSLHKTLVPERAFYDYSSFRSSQRYSRLSEADIADRVIPYANAFDHVIREKADLVLEWYPDCFIPSLAGQIADYYGKPFRMFLQHYWWNDGAFFIDRMDLTSSEVDAKYQYYYAKPALCDRARLDAVFQRKKTLYGFSSSEMYTLAMRARLVANRFKSYEPPSIVNWIRRRISRAWSVAMIRTFIHRDVEARDEPFILFPLHISPEAALLGTSPELADQFGLIKNISMNLPYGVKLYVKEHPYADLGGGIDYGFYRRLATLPNVRIIRADVPLDGLIDHGGFLAVAVVNGTLGLDAAMKRKPVFVFGRPIYGAADCFLKPANFGEFYEQLMTIMRGEWRCDERALYAILNALDASIVRADVDFLTCRTTPELVMTFPRIWRRYVESRAWESMTPELTASAT